MWKWIGALGVVLGGCNIIAGYPNFERVPADDGVIAGGAGGSDGGGTSADGGGSLGGGGAGGAGGSGYPPPLTCSWEAVDRVRSLEGEPPGFDVFGGGQIESGAIVGGDDAVRFAIERNTETGRKLAIWTVRDGRVDSHERDAEAAFGFVRLDGSTLGVLIEEAQLNERTLSLLVMDDSDDSGAAGSVNPLVGVAAESVHFNAAAASPGDGTASVLYTHRVGTAPTEARFMRWNGVASLSVLIDDSAGTSLTTEDYEVVEAERGSGISNHFILGADGDGATHRRHFVIPDDVGGPVMAAGDVAISSTTPLLFGIAPRPEGDFLAAHVSLSTALEVRLGVVDERALPTHTAAGLSAVIPIDAGLLFDEGGTTLTEETLAIVGHQPASPLGLVVMLAHRTGGLRHGAHVPFPDASILPANFEMQRVAPAVSENIDTILGGSMFVAFIVRDTDLGHEELYVGNLECRL